MITLPDKANFRISETAEYFSVSESSVRLWIAHGILQAQKIGGCIRVSRESILQCRLIKSKNYEIK